MPKTEEQYKKMREDMRSKILEKSSLYFAKNGLPWSSERNDKPASELVMPSIFNKNEFIQIYKKLLDYSKLAKDDHLGDDKVEICDEIIEDLKRIETNVKLDEKMISLSRDINEYTERKNNYGRY